MSATVEISIKDLTPLKEFYTNKASELRRLIEASNAELEDVIEVIRALENKITGTKERPIIQGSIPNKVRLVQQPLFHDSNLPGIFNNYNPKMTWERKAIYFIEQFLALTTAEIADLIIQAEPGLDRKKVVSSLSATLSQKTHPKGIFLRHDNGGGEFVYKLKTETILEALDSLD